MEMAQVFPIQRLASVIVFLLILPAAAYGNAFPVKHVEGYLPSVVTIVAMDDKGHPLSSGSGFFLNSSGDIVTNHHVLEGCARAVVTTAQGEKGEIIEIRKDDPGVDLVVARTSFRDRKPLRLGDAERVAVGDRVTVLGCPSGSKGTISTGKIRGILEAEGMSVIQTSAALSEGGSGGPVLNRDGEVIGIAVAFLSQGRDLNFAIPVNYLKTLKGGPLPLGHLPPATTRFEAALGDGALIELFMTPKANGPGTVHFKNGRTLLCDRAWKDGNTVFLVVHGKGVAIGYEESGIDMERSFVMSR